MKRKIEQIMFQLLAKQQSAERTSRAQITVDVL